jgi:hypothetical protein
MRTSKDLRARDRSTGQCQQSDEVGGGTPEAERLISLPELECHPAHERRLWRKSDLSVHLAQEGWGWLQDDDESDDSLLRGGWSMPHPEDSAPAPW